MESFRYEDSDEEDMEYEEVLDLGYVDEVGRLLLSRHQTCPFQT